MSSGMKLFRGPDLLLVLAVAAAAVWFIRGIGTDAGARAVVYVSNKKVAWYDLGSPPRTVEFPTRIGTVRAEFGGGVARILNSPCPNKLCVRHGAIRYRQEQLVCLPAHVLIVLEGGDEQQGSRGRVDAVTQ